MLYEGAGQTYSHPFLDGSATGGADAPFKQLWTEMYKHMNALPFAVRRLARHTLRSALLMLGGYVRRPG